MFESQSPSQTSGFRITDYDWLGFDLDHTLVRYKIDELNSFVYDCILKTLVEKHGYTDRLLQILIDKARGNLIKLDNEQRVYKAMHGIRVLSQEEVERTYGQQKIGFAGTMTNEFIPLTTYFDVALGPAFALLVDLEDAASEGRWPNYDQHLQALHDSVSTLFGNFHGSIYYAEFQRNAGRFLYRADRTKQWAQELRMRNKKLFIVTNSLADYSFGQDWHELFDIVICNARKPAFFLEGHDFHELTHHPEKGLQTVPLSSGGLRPNGKYNGGNFKQLHEAFRNWHGKFTDRPRIVYFGDHLYSDVGVPRVFDVDTVAIIEELEHHIDERAQPREEIHAADERWGSFFGTEDRHSFWYHWAMNRATFSVPHIDYFTHYCIEHFHTHITVKHKPGTV